MTASKLSAFIWLLPAMIRATVVNRYTAGNAFKTQVIDLPVNAAPNAAITAT